MVSPYASKKKNDELVPSDLNTNLCRPVPGQKPLAKHKFYFDLKNRNVANKLETQIKELGGQVELFLVKDVSIVVTDRELWDECKSDTAYSPLNFTNEAGVSAAFSSKSCRPKSRADAMLQRARCQPSTVITDPVEDARRWGIKIWPVEKVFTWLNKLTVKALSYKKKVSTFELKAPYVKFEAFDRKTRPVFKEISDWPQVNLSGSAGDPAFICRSRSERNMTRKTRVNCQRNDIAQPGYCEVCRVEYSHLGKHLQSNEHQKFISDNANFITLDSLISDGVNVESFLNLHAVDGKMCDNDCEYSPPITRNKMPASRYVVSDKQKPKSLPLSPPGIDAGGHRLRSRGHVNYVISTPTDEDEPIKLEEPKEMRELRSSARLNKPPSDTPAEKESDTWDSGRPKRSCILKRRISSDDAIILEPKSYYKVEVMTNRLRSSSVRDHEVKKPQTPPAVKEKVDDKGLIVKFHRIRNSELTHLNNEAENFLFPKKEESSDDDVDADGPNTTASSGKHDSTLLLSSEPDKKTDHKTNKVKNEHNHPMDGVVRCRLGSPRHKQNNDCKIRRRSQRHTEDDDGACSDGSPSTKRFRNESKTASKFKVEDEASMDSNCSENSATKKRKRRTHAEAFIMDNQKYYKFETPGSRLRYQGSFLTPVLLNKSSPPKNNGDLTLKDIKSESSQDSDFKIDLDDLKFAFERVPQEEPWFEAFRRQDTGEVIYISSGSDHDFTQQFLLPYQMPPLPPLDPKLCMSAYKLKQKLLESSSASTSTGSNSSETNMTNAEVEALNDEDSKTSSATDIGSIDIQNELQKLIDEQRPVRRRRRGEVFVTGRNPRKSPRQHASTLAILSSLVHHRRRRDPNKTRSSNLNESRCGLPVIHEENGVDYETIENNIEKLLTESQESNDVDQLEISQEDDGINIRCKPDAIEALEMYNKLKQQKGYPKQLRRTLAGNPARKPGRKKKKNRTGWPNKNRRMRKDHSTKEEDDRSLDSLSHSEDNEENTTDVNNSITANLDKMRNRVSRKDSSDNCAEVVIASVGDKMDCVNVDLEKWESAEKILGAKLTNSEMGDIHLQPVVRVQKLDNSVVMRHKYPRVRTVPVTTRRCRRPRRKPPSSPKSPRVLRKPRGRWYRER